MRLRWSHLGWLANGMIMISSFLPWAYIDLWVITQKISGFKVDGIYTFIAAAIALLFLIWKPGKMADLLNMAVGIVVLFILGNNIFRFQDVLLKKKYFFGIDIGNLITIGYGSYLTFLGGILLILYGIIAIKKRP